MLLELTITNFAIIDRVTLSLSPGFNVLTGETGAGKSILIDAVGGLLGGKLGAEYLRAGADHAYVEGLFLVAEQENGKRGQFEQVQRLLDENGLANGEDLLILRREIGASGRSVARINGRAVPTAILQQIGALLVDIHGQSEHLSLLRVSQHADLLDEYAGLVGLRSKAGALVGQLRQVRRDLRSLLQDERELARRTDLLRFQVEEIGSAALMPGEEVTLAAEARVLSNAEALAASADHIYKLVYEGLDDQRSVSDLLGDVSLKLGEMARLDASLQAEATSAEGVLIQIEDLARALRAYRDRIEFDPARLEATEERLDLIRRLKRKYGNSIEDILRFCAEAAAELESLSHSEERIGDLQSQESALLNEIAALAEELTAARASAAAELAKAMEFELADLNMAKARFAVSLEQTEAADGVVLSDGKRYGFGPTGVDRVEFTVSPNPGEPLKPLARIASGGETARLMLALKSVLAAIDPVHALIFDEIDQGIGGRSGHVVGKKLWDLARTHQVICVTHLPQIACFADAHFSVAKEVVGDRTMTSVKALRDDQRVDEIAAMLGGVVGSEVARRNADEMLAEASSRKERVSPASDVRLNAFDKP
ncbi:MAG: DNA repair protein RecN [Chloroflexi bacterium]|nr:DNA repair protein RecN [Chloroflexota bacterium]